MTNKHSKYLANLICITLIHIICIFGLAVESSAEVKNKCAIVVNNSIVEKTDVHPSGKKEKAKRFIKDIKKSFSLNLIFRNLSKQEVPQSQMYGGLFTVQSSNRISSWKKSPVTKSLTLGLDLPLYGVKYVGAKSKLKQIEDYIEARTAQNISISFSPPKNPTKKQLALYEKIFEKIKEDHTVRIDGKLIEPKLIHGFASKEFLVKIGISTKFRSLLDKVFKEQEAHFEEGMDSAEMRDGIGRSLEEQGGSAYFYGKLDSKGVKEELEVYSARNIVIKHLEFTPLGSVSYLSQHPRVQLALNYISNVVLRRDLSTNSWFRGAKELRISSVLALTIMVATSPMTKPMWEMYEKIDPATHIINKSSSKVMEKSQSLEQESIDNRLKFLIKNDPRFKDIKQTAEGEVTADQLIIASSRLAELKEVLKLSTNTEMPSSAKEYEDVLASLSEFKNSKDNNFLEMINKEVESLSDLQKAVLSRLDLINNNFFYDIAMLIKPGKSNEQAPWVETFQSQGFTIEQSSLLNFDISSVNGLKKIDEMIVERISSVKDYEYFIHYVKNEKAPEGMSDYYSKRLSEKTSSNFYTQVKVLKDKNEISVKDQNLILMEWLNYKNLFNYYNHVGAYKAYGDGRVTMELVEENLLQSIMQ